MPPALRIGCSGWNYKHWRGKFYPPELRLREWFTHYASVFDTVEINNTFYRLPETETFAAWRDRAPEDFLYAIKASRFITHLKRLREPEEPVTRLFERACALQDHLGPVLYQLPESFHCDLTRLDDFLALLPRTLGEINGTPPDHVIRHVFEFRHRSWYVAETQAVLRAHGVVMCLHDKAGSAIFEPLDTPFVYVRFHGPGGRYFGRYELRRMEYWAETLAGQWRAGRDVFAYFNNDPEGMAVINAQELRRLLIASIEGRSRQRMR
ncbi:MAG TPA: DUF72 domain-containing protein [Vicinamibacterales bacterium]|nr:DUF72 domain-containing protein [Vicinamibacterales bacterium]